MNYRTFISWILIPFFLISCFSLPVNALGKDNSKIAVVVIDPGHGGKDPGATYASVKEKDIVLGIALQLGQIIRANYPDIKVVYTRTKDVFIPLHKRASIANKNKANLFISIHANAVNSRSVKGTETFVLGLHRNDENLEVAKKENSVILLEDNYHTTYENFDPNSDVSYIMFANMQEAYQEQSVKFASGIQQQFRNYAKRTDRSVKMAGFLVLRRTTMPSVLIEAGFLSHSKERIYLSSKKGQKEIANAVFRAFKSYKHEIEDKSEFNLLEKDIITAPIQNSSTDKNKDLPVSKQEASRELSSGVYFSVQILALSKKIKTSPRNFKREKNIFRIDSPNVSRYFSGKFNSLEKANAEKERIRKKYKNAFVVAFKNNELISVKKALESQ